MKKLDQDIAEIVAFVRKLRFSSQISHSDQTKTQFKNAYKYFHAMLVWGLVAEALPSDRGSTKNYFREVQSDLAYALLLTLMQYYKPARSSLRSGIENFIRVLLLDRGVDVSKILTVYTLFIEAKKIFSSNQSVKKNIEQLQSLYGDLCKTVHSVKPDYMSLEVPFEKLGIFQSGRFGTNLTTVRSAAEAMNQGIFFTLARGSKKSWI
jgi:hypothetical protein